MDLDGLAWRPARKPCAFGLDHESVFPPRYRLRTHREPLSAESEERLRNSKRLWDQRWNRWWGYNWRRKRNQALRKQRFLHNRQRFLSRVDDSDEDSSSDSHETALSFGGSIGGRKRVSFDDDSPPGLFAKLDKLLHSSASRLNKARKRLFRRIRDSYCDRRAAVAPSDGLDSDRARNLKNKEFMDRAWLRMRDRSFRPENCSQLGCHDSSPLHGNNPLQSLECLARRLERLRKLDRGWQERGTLDRGWQERGTLDRGWQEKGTFEPRQTRPSFHVLGEPDPGTETPVGDVPPNVQPVLVERETGAYRPRSSSRLPSGNFKPRPSDRGVASDCADVSANTKKLESGSALLDEIKLGLNHGLPFAYPHYPNCYVSPTAVGKVGGGRMFSSVSTQTNAARGEAIAAQVVDVETRPREKCRLRNSETQTEKLVLRDKATQRMDRREAFRTCSTQTVFARTNTGQQMPSPSDMCLFESKRAKAFELNAKLRKSLAKSNSIKSVFGSNKTHSMLYRPELGCKDDEVIKLTAMEVFLPRAISYDRYYAELTSDQRRLPDDEPTTPREHGHLTESVTPFIEVTAISEEDDEDTARRKKRRWFCHKK